MSSSFVRRILRGTPRIALSAACLAGMLATASTAHAQGLYASPTSTPAALATGVTPQGVVAADFARSGFQSLAVITNGDNSLNVYLGTGPGTYAAGAQSSTCAGPSTIVAVDANNDGYPDIIVACTNSNTVDIYTNKGASAPGAFPLYPTYTFTVTKPVAMVTGDFLGNGHQDLAVASSTGGLTVVVDTDGTSGVFSTVTVTGTLTGITTGDFNHDGHLDLAVSDSANNNVHVVYGDGTGHFNGLVSYAAGTKPSGIGTADFNHDGNLDLAVSNAGSNSVSILLGSKTGTFTPQATPQSAGLNPVSLVIADVNSDGNPDVIAFDAQNGTGTAENAYVVLLGNGDGTLQTAQISPLSAAPGNVSAVFDFNRDGKPDLAIAQQAVNSVVLLANNTLPTQLDNGRSLSTGQPQAIGNGNMADGVATGDFNLDGKLDVAVTYLEDNVVRVLQNNGSGGFTLSGTYPVGKQPYFVASGDLNGDGFPDLVTANTTDGTISVLLNAGTGLFKPAATYHVGTLPYQVAIGDVNGDGYPDLAVTNYGASTVSVLYGSKAGTFTLAQTLTVGSGETNPYGIVIADLKHNGFPDIAVTAYHTNTLYIFPNNGSGSFGAPYTSATGSGPMSLVSGDFNRDGKLDLVVANATGGPAGDTDPVTSGNNVSFFGGKGDGTVLGGVISPSLNFPQSIAAGDINGDGILDIVGVAPNFNAVSVTLGAGDGTFGTTQQRAAGQFAATKQPWALALGDFNNDGKIDIVTADTYNQVNISIPAYMTRYMTQYPPVANGNPSVDLLFNYSGTRIVLLSSPASPLPAVNTGITVTATVSHSLSGPTPTGSVIFENGSGTALGTGPYALNSSGQASYTTGALGSGQYLFTSLYSGDTNYQPNTASGSGFAVIVSGTPVTLTISPVSGTYGSNFRATVSVTGTPAGGVPQGTITIYGTPGGFTLAPITLVGGSGSETFTASTPNFNDGNYELYAYYTPSVGSPYQPGTSSDVALTITPAPTTTNIGCSAGFLSISCTATVTITSSGVPVSTGNTVNFSVNGGGIIPKTTNAAGQASFSQGEILGSFTVVANFLSQGNYLASTNNTTVFCLLFCGSAREGTVELNAFSGAEFSRIYPALERNREMPFSMF
jgi:hypothetical protein